MTRGAKAFLNFIRSKANRNGQSWWGQQTMAKEMDVHRSTINRWVAELVAAGELDSIRRGSTSNLYTLRISTVEKIPRATSNVAKCDNASLILNSKKENSQLGLEFPQPYTTNEYGRTDPNPEYQYLVGVLRAAKGRIARADNPAAYERAVWQRELLALRKPPERQESSFTARATAYRVNTL